MTTATTPVQPVFPWRDAYNVGIPEVDQQHRKLVAIINELHCAMQQGSGRESLGSILDQLIDYAAIHFRAEEGLLARNRWHGLEAHKVLHQQLTTGVTDLRKKFRAGKLTVTIETMVFLKNWLRDHILDEDMIYAADLRKSG